MNQIHSSPSLDPLTLTRLHAVLSSQNERDPDPERTKLLANLAVLRRNFPEIAKHVTGSETHGSTELTEANLKLIEYLQMLERSSLGTPGTRRSRRTVSPHIVDGILARSDRARQAKKTTPAGWPVAEGSTVRQRQQRTRRHANNDTSATTPRGVPSQTAAASDICRQQHVKTHAGSPVAGTVTAQPWAGLEGGELHAACLNAARTGNRTALDVLVTELTPLVWHVARGMGLDPSTSEDVVATVWLKVVRHLDRLTEPRTLVRWMITTTRREASRAWRVPSSPGPDAGDTIDGGSVVPETALIRNVRDQRLWRAFHRLPQRFQELLRLTVLAGRAEYQAVAEALHMPKGSIGPTRGQALRLLRELYEEEGGD